MASSGGYMVKVRGKRATDAGEETLYLDLGRLVLASDAGHGLAMVLEGGERVLLTGDDAAWVREILDDLVPPRKGQRGQGVFGGRR